MGKYIKKPIPIECKHLINDYDTIVEIYEWYSGEDTSTSLVAQQKTVEYICNNEGLDIETMEGIMHASFGDWIIKGIRGEFYPCKPDIFEESYKPYNPDVETNNLEDLTKRVSDSLIKGYNYTLSPEIRNDIDNLCKKVKSIFE